MEAAEQAKRKHKQLAFGIAVTEQQAEHAYTDEQHSVNQLGFYNVKVFWK